MHTLYAVADPVPAAVPSTTCPSILAPQLVPLAFPAIPVLSSKIKDGEERGQINTYRQRDGRFVNAEGILIGIGYSGNGKGLNNPEMQNVAMRGPIPQGEYEIGPALNHPKLGCLAMALVQADGTNSFGRSGFFIHGDNDEMNHTASEGCIILDHQARAAIAASKDRLLRVIA